MPDATEQLTIDEQFRALMEGVRTSIPAVQVLFAFLLTAPLQSGFDDLSGAERGSFALAFYASGVASILLVAPSVHQRMRAPKTGLERHSKRHLVWATWLTIVGSIANVVAVGATTFLVSSVVFEVGIAVVATGLLTAMVAWSWFYLPLVAFGQPGTAENDGAG